MRATHSISSLPQLDPARSPDLELEDTAGGAIKRAAGIVRCMRAVQGDPELSAAAWAVQRELDTALAAFEQWKAMRTPHTRARE